MLHPEVPSWIAEAACLGHPAPHWWLGVDRLGHVQACRVCSGCPVLDQCASYADEIDAEVGVWAGQVRRRREGHSDAG